MIGSIEKRAKGQYRLRLDLGRDPVTKKRLRPSKTITGTRKQAEKALRDWLSEFETTGVTVVSTVTLDTYMAEWFQAACRTKVKPRTFNDYQDLYERYVSRYDLGRTALNKLTAFAIQRHYVDLLDKGLAAVTVGKVHVLLHQALKQAVRWRRIPFNPVADVDKPRRSQKRETAQSPKPAKKAMEPQQIIAFLDAAMETPHACLFDVAASSGARPGEYLGLGWDCVLWEEGAIRIERAAVFERKLPPYLSDTKTEESPRTIKLPPTVMKSLREHRRAQREWQILKGPAFKNEHNLVFPDERGNLRNYKNFVRTFKRIAKMAELPASFSPYTLRHSCATALLQANEHARIVQERLGHSSIVQTMDTYSHVLPGMQQSAADKLEAMIFGSR